MFSVKGQRVNSLSVVGHTVSATTLYLCHCPKQPWPTVQKRASVAVVQ